MSQLWLVVASVGDLVMGLSLIRVCSPPMSSQYLLAEFKLEGVAKDGELISRS